MTIASENSVMQSLREYLHYLIENDVHDVYLPLAACDQPCSESEPAISVLTSKQKKLEEIEAELRECRACGLSEFRSHIVFGEGNQRADILFVIDGPNAEEDQAGRIVRGESGTKLEEIIEKGMNLALSEVYICPLIKCRPPQGRALLDEEVQACIAVFNRQLAVIAPKVIIALGARVTQILLGSTTPIEQLRGTWHAYQGIPLMPTYHPAYVLDNYTVPVRKQVWNDVREALKFMENLLPKGKK